MKIKIAQLNPIIGDIEGNLNKLQQTVSKLENGTDLVIFSELFLTGYPPRDLLVKPWFIKKIKSALAEIKKMSRKVEAGILLGTPMPTTKKYGRGLYNSAVLIYQGEIIYCQNKSLLPTYDVFDEARYFDSAEKIGIVNFKGKTLGISICEDMWNVEERWQQNRYARNPIEELAAMEAEVLINISASPFSIGKDKTRYKIIKNHVQNYNLPFIMVNQVGSNDELIFDGSSLVVDKAGEIIAELASFSEDIKTVDLKKESSKEYKFLPEIKGLYQALVLGIRDYLDKCGFKKAVIGLSGGIDSSVSCCLAKEALGKENVLAVTMPGPYSSAGSVEDSKELAKNLGIELKEISISKINNSYLSVLKDDFQGTEAGVAEENIQARIRGDILMAFSNKFGHLVLSPGNKSELAVGYCTLYGDMSGGLSIISDVPKTMVYQLAEYINSRGEIIPASIINKAPSAELRPEQKDEDSLPPYEILDQILYYYIEEGYSASEIIESGFDSQTVKEVIRLVDGNEYKRRQAAPGLKVTSKAFGMGRRMPIAAKFNSD
ncbi:NAD+ synthase (glutamine-hydrolysing) [Halanaerobium saccharolyticum]|uniref:Glutamine-dependent NAD(+) synthetase n=1 Tax=Halanaerobium saccharolyticum TaxID=43595 RepID=A0A4R7Z582_9FIRM|nr:NAD+ synthase [Halanaerobium saccharolyticum]RAK09344.1 NAD+ synthase (glutamine-hydrolysing) [Halanaerobium saccharolyticum]TDW06203.1 NAD+ synthase (glutamine-hydrolysing) [Halanaerobium saccharolyticum]TDX60997.1 NAD+ synthase (glutamine-hydrolysing) [Halanaerobium saccharolyticum]